MKFYTQSKIIVVINLLQKLFRYLLIEESIQTVLTSSIHDLGSSANEVNCAGGFHVRIFELISDRTVRGETDSQAQTTSVAVLCMFPAQSSLFISRYLI